MLKGLKNVNIVTLNGILKGNIEIKNGFIQDINQNEDFNGKGFNEMVYVVPGFIDEHVHGVSGYDTMDATIKSMETISNSLVKEGTTSFLATTITQSDEKLKKALLNIKNYMLQPSTNGAKVLGVHLEGPFINKEACGAQPKDYVVKPDINRLRLYQDISGAHIKMVTLAPELNGAKDIINYCHTHYIVASIGHTKATYQDVINAIHNGASSITHCFNAMTPIHHRDVGVVGAALLKDDLHVELIADLIHVDKNAIQLLYKNKGCNKITLITDSIRAKGLPNGQYDLGGQTVNVKDKHATLSTGVLAGSVLRMIDGFKNIMKIIPINIIEASKLVSTNPAKKLGVFDEIGSIEIGKKADLVVLNKDFDLLLTICNGKIVYNKNN